MLLVYPRNDQCVGLAGDFCFPKRNCAFLKIKIKVTLRRDPMIMCRYMYAVHYPGDDLACLPSGNPHTRTPLAVAINRTLLIESN